MSALGVAAPRLRAQQAALAVIVLGSVALYAASVRASFTFDDIETVRGNAAVQGPFSLRAIFLHDFWGRPFGALDSVGTYRPIVTLSFWLDRVAGGGSPWCFHLTNLAWFALLLGIANSFLSRFARDELPATARFLVLAAFGAMTIHVDVVPSITGRAELFAMTFSLAALAAACGKRPMVARAGAIFSCVLAALLSKESAMPMAILVPWFAARRATPGRRVREVLPVLAASLTPLALVVAFRARYLPFTADPKLFVHDNPLFGAPVGRRLLGAAEVLARYLEHALVGAGLAPDYSFSSIVLERPVGPRTLLGLIVAVAGTFALVRAWRTSPGLADALVGFGASYVVVSHVLVPSSAILADRLFFFPSFWLLLVIGMLLVQVPARLRAIVASAAVSFCVLHGLQTALSAPAWHDQLSLFSNAVASKPNNARVRANLAAALAAKGAVREAAWHQLVGCLIVRGGPPVSEDRIIPEEWENRPVSERHTLLRQRIGNARFEALQAAARDDCSSH